MVATPAMRAFGAIANPAMCYETELHQRLLERLWRVIQHALSLGIVLGDYGSGKTSLLRKIAATLAAAPDRYNCGQLPPPMPFWSSLDLLRAIGDAFQLPIATEWRHEAILQALRAHCAQDNARIHVLLIDDAQYLLAPEQLDMLRRLQHFETPHGKLLNVLCFGHEAWRRVLRNNPSFTQCASLLSRMPSIPFKECRALLQHRMQQAGLEAERLLRFEAGALERLYEYSGGNPGRMVYLCRFLFAERTQATYEAITLPQVEACIAETTLDGLSPQPPPNQSQKPTNTHTKPESTMPPDFHEAEELLQALETQPRDFPGCTLQEETKSATNRLD